MYIKTGKDCLIIIHNNVGYVVQLRTGQCLHINWRPHLYDDCI